jgi:hypothetical protein
MPTELERISAIRIALAPIVGTPGWFYVKKIADNVVDAAKDSILDAETPEEREELALKATALKKGFAELFKGIESLTSFEEREEDDDWYANLNFEAEQG